MKFNIKYIEFFVKWIISVFARALHALAKVGDNLYIEASDCNLTFVSLNLRKTICVKCTFFDSFFSSYELNGDDNVSCKIQMKTLIPLFKGNHLEKKVCHSQGYILFHFHEKIFFFSLNISKFNMSLMMMMNWLSKWNINVMTLWCFINWDLWTQNH